MNRSDDAEPYLFSESSSRRLPPSSSHASEHRLGVRHAPSHHWPGEDVPAESIRSPFMPGPRSGGSPDRSFAPHRSSGTSYRSFRSIEDSPEFPEPQYHRTPDAAQQPAEFPGRMELVRYGRAAEREELPYSGHSRDQLQAPPMRSSNDLSRGWSVAGTRGTTDSARSPSNSSSYSQGLHSDDSGPLEYSGMPTSRGYVESYDVCSYDNHYPRDSEEYYGDEGIDYSSSEYAEDDGFGYDDLSDEGYYSGGSYDNDGDYD
ncbi:hypothetical protein M413DRAFT_441546 [Hebeloma cylindrosporum]|uniref:Uncharacterized protein n=1 Tax=Hebeloma cylindrosporum TaxID=76867 RepID=A0A0C2YZP2_HEBCY|nr:hypothetical protein M413DRAFT_441546 [Hebeloma cylindrosporum h7]